MKNLTEAALAIKKASREKQNIVLFSDADLDGISSLLILEETIESLGGLIKKRYFPNRETQGYGLTTAVLDDIKKFAPGLLIITDSSISNFTEIKKAKKIGFFVLIVDHHEIIKEAPQADLIINPKQPGDDYPFKFLAATGLCFYLAKQILGNNKQMLIGEFSALAAIATIADMMEQREDNQIIIEQGLADLLKTQRPGLLAVKSFFPKESFDSKMLARKIISILQLTDFKGNLTESYLLLKESNYEKAKQQVKILIEKNKRRKDLIKSITAEIAEKEANSKEKFVLFGDESIPHLLTGNIASKVLHVVKKPVFIYSQKQKMIRGSVRAPKVVNCISVLMACSKHLDVFGGHPPAAGFSLENKNINKFKKCLANHFEKTL